MPHATRAYSIEALVPTVDLAVGGKRYALSILTSELARTIRC